ncbi:MAG: hypothetical protein K8W52_07050 [Deltaproteobacteria bacterium]|nr:hypothetical protein [Deltaproteobacteria bacterium]
MSDTTDLAAWMEKAIAVVADDVGRARALVSDAAGQLFSSFDSLRGHLATERQSYEAAVDAITGMGGDQGLAGAMREILRRFVDDIDNIGKSSARILSEVSALRGNAAEVAGRGQNIEKIARATRLISFNATIEAERVGADGAVFRVVADEIKRLAEETGSLSKAIRTAIEGQDLSLTATSDAAAALASYDLATAVAGHKELGATIEHLEQVSASSKRSLERIQVDVDAAIRALQFEDMLTQLLDSVRGKLDAIRGVCGQIAGGQDGAALRAALAATDAQIHRNAVTQRDVASGGIELF